MSRPSQRQQMNVPIRPKNNEEVQTDVNLVGFTKAPTTDIQVHQSQTRFLEFVNESWMKPFSDYYLLGQLSTVIDQLRNNLGNGEQFRTRKVVDELASKIHGLLARELKVTSNNKGYYDVLLEKEKQITRLEIKYGSFERKIQGYLEKIQQLQREIKNLRGTLKNYQIAAQQNQLYKGFFRDLKQSTSKKVSDMDKLLNQQILPKIRQFEVNLSDVTKTANKDRNSKQKAAISKYAAELDALSRAKDLDWGTLSNSAAVFFNSIEHLNDDDWVQHRLNLAEAYEELRNRHVGLISIVSKNVQQLLKKDASFRSLTEVSDLIRTIEKQNQQGFETIIVNGWIGLGVTRYGGQFKGTEQFDRLRDLILVFQREIRKLTDKYPQLDESLSVELRQFLKIEISKEVSVGDSLQWIKQILVKETEIIRVDNVYNYYSKADKDNIYYLRILVKALIDELKRITTDHKIGIELDQGILELLRAQSLNGVNIQDIIALFRPNSRVCEVDVIINKPTYLPMATTVGVPLRQEKAVIVNDTAHFAVNLQQGVAYRKQVPYEYSKTEVVQMPVNIEIPYAVPTKIVEQVINYEERVNIVEVPVETEKYIEVIRQNLVESKEQVLVTEEVYREVRVPYNTSEIQTKQIEVEKQVAKNVYKQISKIFKVEQVVPKVYKEPKFEIIEKPVHHVIIEKQIEFVQVEKPVIERLEVAKVVQVIVEKPIYFPEHCECQKPEAVVVQIQKPIIKQVVKEVVVQKSTFVQGNTQEKIVQVPCHSQVPIFKQVIKQEPVIVEKVVPFRTVEEKLVVVDRQIPFFVQHFTPVELIVQKPIIVRDIKHVPVEVEQPVPIYIEKVVPRIVQVFRDRIVEKIVEVPRVEIVEKIVQKIVTIPRIVERIVTVTQIVEVPVFIETPVIEIVEVPVERLVTDIIEKEKIVEVKTEVLKIERAMQVVEKIDYQQVRKVIEVEPESYPEVIRQKIVRVIEEKPVEVYIDRLVDRVIQVREVIPIEQRVEVPIEIQIPVEIIIEKPVFYKQPVVQIDVQRVEREKIVELDRETIRIEQVKTPYIQKQTEIVRIPADPIILREPELHIVQIEKEIVITANDVQERPVEHYLDIHRAHVVDQQTFVIPEKEVVYLQKPFAVTVEKPIAVRHQEMIVVERPDTKVVKTRQGIKEQVVKVVTQEKLVAEKQSYPEPITVPQHHYHVLYEQLPPKVIEKSVLAIDEKVKTTQVTSTVEIEGTSRQVITKQIEVPVYMEKIFEKILMLPQIVEVEKRVYMVEQINSLIAKQVNIETHYEQYKNHVSSIEATGSQLLALLNSKQKANTQELKKRLNLFLELLRTESKIPKIVQTIKEVEVVKERDRPVLVPVYDSEKEKVLQLIISDLLAGIKNLGRDALTRGKFSASVISLIETQFVHEVVGQSSEVVQTSRVQTQSKWNSWLNNYDRTLPDTLPSQGLTQAERQFLVGFDARQTDYASLRASLQSLSIVHRQRLNEIQGLRRQYGKTIDELRLKVQSLQTQSATEKYYKDLYLNELLKVRSMLENKQYDQVLSAVEIITTIRQEIVSTRIKTTSEERVRLEAQFIQEGGQTRLSEVIGQITVYESQAHEKQRQIQNLKLENQRLQSEIDEVKLNVPVWNKETSTDDNLKRYNEQWEAKIIELEQNHFLELNHLREKLMSRLAGDSTEGSDQFTKAYDQLMGRYTSLAENQRNAENDKRNLINTYEDKLRDINKQLNNLRRDYDNLVKKGEAEKKRITQQYERRLTSTASNQEQELRVQLETLRRRYDQLETKTQAESRKIIEQYEKKISSSQVSQEKDLKKDLQQTRKNLELAEQKLEKEKKKIANDYQAKLNERERVIEDLETRLKQAQDEAEKARKGKKPGNNPQQLQQLKDLKEKIRRLEEDLKMSKNQIEAYQKSRLAATTYTSGVKRSGIEGEFQSPEGRFKSGFSKQQEVIESSRYSQEQGVEIVEEKRRITRSNVRGERTSKVEESEQIRSQSSRVSGASSTSSRFKTSMTMREFLDLPKDEDKDNIITMVMIKIIEKIQEQADKGIINSYTPSNIYLSNFNPNNLDALIVRFGAPITNRKSKTDGLYLAPEVLRGEGTTIKSVAYTLAIIWDQLIHYELYYKTVADIENLALEYRVRDGSLNPILRNTIFEMMSKDPAKRLELSEAKRRLSLQRYILSDTRGGASSSRVSTQRRQ